MAQVYQAIARKLDAMHNCARSGNREWFDRHSDAIDSLVKEYLPYGGGFNAGCIIDKDSPRGRIVIETSFHHMSENGYYDGWTSHKVIVTACLSHGFELRITGKDKNGIKDYIADTFHHVLSMDCAL